VTTADLTARVVRRFTPRPQAAPTGIVLTEVPHGIEPRRADVLVVNFYPSAPPLVGVEVKATRSDWLAELGDAAKATAWARHCAQWWIAAAPEVVRPGELPDGWGLLEPVGKRLLLVRRQADTVTGQPLPPAVAAALVHRAGAAHAHERRRAEAAHQATVEHLRAQIPATAGPGGIDTATVEDARTLRALIDAAALAGHRFDLTARTADSAAGQALLAAAGGLAEVNSVLDSARQDALRLRAALRSAVNRLDAELDGL
jgi:hypothetical protein